MTVSSVLSNLFTLKVNKNDAGQRLDKFLTKSIPSCPISLIYKSIRKKKIKVNRKRCYPEQILSEGQTVYLFISDEFINNSKQGKGFLSIRNPHLEIAYENDNLIICDKAPGVSCHSNASDSENTLIDNIKSYLYLNGKYNPDEENSFSPALCNRIDRNTGGLVIAAKNAETLRLINEKIKKREIVKRYLLAVHGILPEKTGTLKHFLVKNQDDNTVAVYDKISESPESKTAITEYRVLAENNNLSLIEAELKTGRTHQIRAQFAHIGHPLLGDGKYGINKEDRERGYKYQALYSYYLKIDKTEVYCNINNIKFLSEFPDFHFFGR